MRMSPVKQVLKSKELRDIFQHFAKTVCGAGEWGQHIALANCDYTNLEVLEIIRTDLETKKGLLGADPINEHTFRWLSNLINVLKASEYNADASFLLGRFGVLPDLREHYQTRGDSISQLIRRYDEDSNFQGYIRKLEAESAFVNTAISFLGHMIYVAPSVETKPLVQSLLNLPVNDNY